MMLNEVKNFNERINLHGEKEKLKVGCIGHLYNEERGQF